jgi:hypothetical protein
VRQTVGVVLRRVTEAQGVDSRAEQFDELIADAIVSTGIVQPLGERLRDSQPMVGLPQQQEARVGGDPIIARNHLDGTVETRFK